MAGKDEDAWRRLRRREEEDEAEQDLSKEIKKASSGSAQDLKSLVSAGADKLDEMIQRADPLLNQLNTLYNMFISGVESLPPVEKRKTLDQLMAAIQMINKPTPAALYKYNAILYKYTSHRDRWDKMLRDLEDGKIKRVAGPQRKRAG